MGLKTEAYFNPCKVSWVNNFNIKVNEKCLVTYYIGVLIENVEYNVLPMKVCRLLVCQPWLFDGKVKHCLYNNTCVFKHSDLNLKLVLLPKKKPETCSVLGFVNNKTQEVIPFEHIPQGDDILGAHPKSSGPSSFQ